MAPGVTLAGKAEGSSCPGPISFTPQGTVTRAELEPKPYRGGEARLDVTWLPKAERMLYLGPGATVDCQFSKPPLYGSLCIECVGRPLGPRLVLL